MGSHLLLAPGWDPSRIPAGYQASSMELHGTDVLQQPQQLQALAKKNGIKADLASAEIIKQLTYVASAEAPKNAPEPS